jgi:hypothetical protein
VLGLLAPPSPWGNYREEVVAQIVERVRARMAELPEMSALRQAQERAKAASRAVEEESIRLGELQLERRRHLNLAAPTAEDLFRVDKLRQEIEASEAQLGTLRRSAAAYREGQAELLQAAREAVRRLASEQASEVYALVEQQAHAALHRAAVAAGPHMLEWLRFERRRAEFRGADQ